MVTSVHVLGVCHGSGVHVSGVCHGSGGGLPQLLAQWLECDGWNSGGHLTGRHPPLSHGLQSSAHFWHTASVPPSSNTSSIEVVH